MIPIGFALALLAAHPQTDPAPEPEPPPAPTPAPAPAAEESPAPDASPLTWSVNEEGVVRSWSDNPDTDTRREDLTDGMNRLFGVATWKGFEVGAQLDIAFAHPAERAAMTQEATLPPPGATTSVLLADSDDDELEYAVVFEKKLLKWRGERGAIEIGDNYRALGRGLALALVRNTELDIDTTLEGVSGDLTLGSLEASLFGGYSNPQTVSVAFPNHLVRDARDVIAGARASWSGPLELFAHGAIFRYDDEVPTRLLDEGELFTPETVRVGGGGFSIPTLAGGAADLYVEAVGMALEGEDFEGGAVDQDGWGGYLAANVYAGPLTVTLEGKSYKNLEMINARAAEGTVPYDYSTPPTLEKENIVNYNSTKAVNSNDVHGGKASVSLPLWKGFLGRLTYLRLDDLGHRTVEPLGNVIDENESIHHGFVTVEKRAQGFFFQLTTGARYETRLEDPDVHETQVHVDGDLLVPLFAGVSLELKGLAYRQTEESARNGFQRTDDVTSTVLSVRPLPWMSVAGLVDTTTDERVTSGFGGRPGNLSDQAYGAVEISVEPTGSSSARLFAGSTQGGLKCSGGTCRVVPAFEGVRVEWLARF